ILHYYAIQPAIFHSRRELREPTAAEVHTADVVVGGLADHLTTPLSGKLPADPFLVLERVPLRVVVVGQPGIDPHSHLHSSVLIEIPHDNGSQPLEVIVLGEPALYLLPVFVDINVIPEGGLQT